ncbi:MAG: hypothetical protein JRJ46_06485 [Deltaproteobacteria bacterium]|nr:hypothetical protein [Deltaproteobacteria bacterium]
MIDQDLYWLFSTVAQTLGAIIGVVGMLTVYRLQNISNTIRDHYHSSEDARNIFGLRFTKNATFFIEQWGKYKKANPQILDKTDYNYNEAKDLDIIKDEIKKLMLRRAKIKSKFVESLIINLIILFGSIAIIPFSKIMIETNIYYGVVPVVLFVYLPYSFYLIYLLCAELIKDPPKDKNPYKINDKGFEVSNILIKG